MRNNLFIIIILAILLMSCSGVKKITKGISKYPVPLDYENTTVEVEPIKANNLSFTLLNSIDSTTSITPKGRFILPLIILTYSQANIHIKLGQDFLDEDYQTFFNQSLISKSQQSGNYSCRNAKTKSEYHLEISIDTCEITSKYHRHRTTFYPVVFVIDDSQEKGSETFANLQISTKLYKKDVLISSKNYKLNKAFPFKASGKSVYMNRYLFMKNMSKSLALSTNEIINQIIQETNNYFAQQNI